MHIRLARRWKSRTARNQSIGEQAQRRSLGIGERRRRGCDTHAGTASSRACSTMCVAQRFAKAQIVDVGLTAPAVTNTLPSTM
jgi:hypothetical protein